MASPRSGVSGPGEAKGRLRITIEPMNVVNSVVGARRFEFCRARLSASPEARHCGLIVSYRLSAS